MILFTATAFAQLGTPALESQSAAVEIQTNQKDADDILLPGNWHEATAVGTFRWVDTDQNPVGWIFGNNTYGTAAAGQKFIVDAPYEIEGAYFWLGAIGSGNADLHFTIWDYDDGAVGDVIASVTISMDQVDALVIDEDTTPDEYMDAFYVEFDAPVAVTSDYVIGVDFSEITWTAHGDGVGFASTIPGQGGGGLGLAYANYVNHGGWILVDGLTEGDLNVDLGVFVVVADDNGNGDEDTFTVTLNVDMADAVAENDVAFDPAVHRVFVTGSFAGWAMPGSDDAFELFPANGDKNDEGQVVFAEGFEDWDPASPGALPDGWEVFRNENLTENPTETPETQRWVANNPDSNPFGGAENPDAWQDYVRTGEGSMIIGFTAPNFTWAITPEIDLPMADNIEWVFWMWYTRDGGAGTFPTNFHVNIYADGTWTNLQSWEGEANNNFDSAIEIDITEYQGQTVKLAFVYEYTDGYQMAIDDIEVTAYGVVPSEEDIYTITLQMEEGTHEYKYFLIEDEPTWGIGEWPGDPNRTITVTGDATFNDVFGVDPTASVGDIVAENATMVFPNPTSNYINVTSANLINEVRIFDLSGRVVFSSNVEDFHAVVNVSSFNRGMYIMQIFGENGVETQRFQVVK
jgi:hypothetical protein